MMLLRLATKKLTTTATSPATRRMLVRSIATQATCGSSKQQRQHGNTTVPLFASLVGLTAATTGSVTYLDSRKSANKSSSHYEQPIGIKPNKETPTNILDSNRINQPPSRPDLPIYTLDEVAEHTDPDSLWYTFRGGVYDLTPFYEGHPGGAPVRTAQGEKRTQERNEGEGAQSFNLTQVLFRFFPRFVV